MSQSPRSESKSAGKQIQGPRGTRDLYPAEAARRRWLLERWREVSVRHGFEEVDGPTFEESDLYAVKSGEGILGELFQAFSGKSPDEVEQVKATGRGPFALRPEFTPTLARMYAARAAGLPKPCKWFMAGPFFRAERPQRGRLREFLQWNCDVLGLDIAPEKWHAEDAEGRAEVAESKARTDAEVIACCVAYLESTGLTPADVQVRVGSRTVVDGLLDDMRVPGEKHAEVFTLLDRRAKLGGEAFAEAASGLLDVAAFDARREGLESALKAGGRADAGFDSASLMRLFASLDEMGLLSWCTPDLSIARGLAYYTGTVFEVIADGERAVAGGGRYDNLVELFGGPRTPAVGFAMGDVVLSLLLQDKGLMPSDEELMGLVGQRPQVFVLSNGTDEADAQVRRVVAVLRRGDLGLHVRHSYKATKNIGKLLKEASGWDARFAVIVESPGEASVKNLQTGQQWEGRVAINALAERLAASLGK
ncbi:MAG: histidine--tRNA ligase family protein [Phycisphaerales bacterium]|nr:histidine--tRNA ligase family protein [Phycisphaerales bacterium]